MRTIKIHLNEKAIVANLIKKAQAEVERANSSIEYYQQVREKYQRLADHATNNLPVSMADVVEDLGAGWVKSNAAADLCGFCGGIVMDGVEIIQDADEDDYDSRTVCTFICSYCMGKHVTDISEE